MDAVENPDDIESGHPIEGAPVQQGAEDFLATAVSLLKQGRLEEAEVQARKALEADGDGFSVQRTLGMIARDAKRPKDAVEHFGNAKAFEPLDVGNLLDIGQQSRESRDHDAAIAAYSAALDITPDLIVARRGLALAEQARGNDAAALEHFRIALSLDDKHSVTHLGMAGVLRKLGRMEEAARSAQDAIDCDPRLTEAHRLLAFINRDRGNNAAALAEFAAARELSPRNVWLHLDMATELRALGRLDEAEASCREALALDPDLPTGYRLLGFIARDRKDHAGAIGHLEKFRQYNPDDHWNILNIANEYRTLERYDEAIAQYQAALTIKPDFADPHRQIGIIERLRGNREAALAAFAAASDLAPDNVWFAFDTATEFRHIGRLDEAEARFRRLLELAPDFVQAHRSLGLIARDRGDHAGALAHFENAARHGPSDAWTIFEIATEYRAVARHDEAIAQYRAAISLKPDLAEAHRQIGMIERSRGDREAALAAFAAARDLIPGNAWFHLDAVTEFRALGRLDEAEAGCRRILEFAPDFVSAHRTLGLVSRERGDHQQALAHFEEARRHGPSDAWIVFEIASEFRALGNPEGAIAQYHAALGLKPDFPEAHRQIGMLERTRGDREAALAAFTSARDLAPDNAWFHLDVVNELRVLRRLDEAEACCQWILEFSPDFVAAHRALGYVARDRRDHEAAIAAFETARQYSPTDHWLVAEIANDYRTLERFDDAIAQYYTALALNPSFAEAHRQIGMIERTRGNEAAAIGHFEIALFQLEHNAAGTEGRAALAPVELLLLLNRIPAAEERLARLDDPASDPDALFEVHSLRAQIGGKKRDTISELMHRREMTRLRPTSAWVWQTLIERHTALNMPDAALADITEALTHLPDEQTLLIERARALRLVGRAEEAAAQLRLLVPDQLDSASSYMRLANELRSSGMPEEARRAAEDAVRLAPHFAWAHLSLAFTILEQEGPVAGIEQFKRELARNPDNIEALCQISRLLRESGDAPGARDFLLQRGASVMSPFRVLDEFIVCLCQCDELDRARELVARREALALAGEELLGPAIEIELASGDTKRLAELVSRAQESSAHNPDVLSRIIRAAHVLNDLDTVIKTNRAWIGRDPARMLHGELAIAEAEFRLGHQDQAMATLGSLKQRFGDFQDLYLTTGRLFRSSGKLRGASTCFQLGLRKFPNHVQMWEEYVRLCIQTDRIDTARSLLAAVDEKNYMMAASRDLLTIELDLERSDIDGALAKIERFQPRYMRHGAQYHTLCFRASLAALDLESARRHLSAEIAIARFDRKLRRQSNNVSQSLMGQILDEYRLDSGNVRDLVAIARLTPDEGTERFFEQVRANPGSTATAITTLIHVRQMGGFAHSGNSGPSDIPRRIAQFWDRADVPADIARYMESWRDNNAGWEYQLFSSDSAGEFIAANCPPDVARAYQRSTDPTTKADLFRLAWLSHRGGVYVDADDVSTGPIEAILTPESRLIAHQEDIGSFGNNFMGAVAGHPVIATALEEATGSILRGDSEMVWLATGPGMMSRVFTQWLAADAGNRAALGGSVVIFNRGELTAVCAAHCQAAYKLTPLHWAKGMFG